MLETTQQLTAQVSQLAALTTAPASSSALVSTQAPAPAPAGFNSRDITTTWPQPYSGEVAASCSSAA